MANRMVPQAEALEILKAGSYGVLSTASADGEPYGVPVNYCYSEQENLIFFHCARAGKKLDNIRNNPRVSFVVIGREEVIPSQFITHYESVVVTGRASLVSDGAVLKKWLVELCEKFAPEALARRGEVIEKYLPAVSICEISIDNITGKRNNDD